jgi:hypothetical protein
MLAKPLKVAGGCRVTKTIARSCAARRFTKAGGTASAKRTQGSGRAAGDFASPLRLIQPRKQESVEADLVTSRGRQHRHERHGERVQVPPGSSKIVARSQRSVDDESPVPVGRTGAPRTREASPPLLLESRQGTDDQLTEGASVYGEESDSPIVVRDGRTDHTAKGWAERQREHSTHRGRRLLPNPVSSSLLALVADIWFTESDAQPIARLSEEPCARKPHAGICEGGTR